MIFENVTKIIFNLIAKFVHIFKIKHANSILIYYDY